MGGGGESITYTLTADTENKTIVLTPSEGTAQVITVPYATDASTVNGHEVPELENGKIPANYLPSFVDNVDEYDNISLFPVVGESNRIYIDKSTNKTYRWSGTAYVEISESIALGETSSTAYRGDRGKIAYDHSQSAHAPSNAEANQNAFSNVKIDSDIINASTKTDTLEFIAGDNIILTPNVSNKKITVSQMPVRKTASGDIASFSDGTGDPFLEVKVNINPVQSGSGDPSPSNVRPISGWSGANVTKCGVNVWNEEWERGSLNTSTGQPGDSNSKIRTVNYIPVLPNTEYRIVGYALAIYEYGSDNSFIGYTTYSVGTFITGANTYFIKWTRTETSYANDISINYPSTDTSYHAYQGSTLSIPFHDNSDNPITVYGGTLNVTSGELTVTMVSINLEDYASSIFFNTGYNCWVLPITPSALFIGNYDIPNVLTSVGYIPRAFYYGSKSDNAIGVTSNGSLFMGNNSSTVKPTGQVVYPLATPQTYQLTPAQVSTLLGQNNIFADCGQILDGEYFVTL